MPSFMDIMNRLCLDKIKNRNKEPTQLPDVIEYIVDKKILHTECLICLEEFNEGETVSLIKCGHNSPALVHSNFPFLLNPASVLPPALYKFNISQFL